MKFRRAPKFLAKRTTILGHTFDSKKEAKRYLELCALEQAGEITDLKIHPSYVLQEPFEDREGEHHRAITYEADFEYRENGMGPTVVEDVKSAFTAKNPVFRLKMKMFLKVWPQYDFRIVGG